MKLHEQRGFTLIELLVVIGIIAVMSAVLIPSIGGILGRAAAVSAEGELANMQTAVDLAMADNGLATLDNCTPDPVVTPADGALSGVILHTYGGAGPDVMLVTYLRQDHVGAKDGSGAIARYNIFADGKVTSSAVP